MGKPAIQKKCLRCAKKFWSKPIKDKTGKYWEEEFCQKCRHLRTTIPQKLRNEQTVIRVVSKKINVEREVELLRRLEHYNPAMLERMRKGEK